MNILRKADQFGVLFNLNISHAEKLYKSAFGGLVTILVYSLSLVYFIYKIYSWQSNQTLPTITQQDISKTYAEVNFTNTISLQISAIKYFDQDPFNITNAVVLCFYGYYQDGQLRNLSLLKPIANQSSTRSSIFRPENMSLVLNSGSKTNETPLGQKQSFLFFSVCDNETAQLLNITCANNDTINYYFSIPQRFDLEIHTQQYDIKTQSLKPVIKHLYYNMDIGSNFYGQIEYQMVQHYVDDNLFVQQQSHQQYISGFNMLNQPLSQKFIDSSQGYAGFVTLLISVSANQQEYFVQYPKFGQILADVGSIVSLLLSLSIIVQVLNSKLMEDQLFFDIISLYFPDYKKYTIKKNLFGKITSITLKNHIVDQSQFLIHYELMREKAKEKFSITNIIYEISRLQFIMQTIVERQTIMQCHQMGIKTLNQSMSSSMQDSIVQIRQSPTQQFIQDDFTLLSIYKFYQINEEEEQIDMSPQPTKIKVQPQ